MSDDDWSTDATPSPGWLVLERNGDKLTVCFHERDYTEALAQGFPVVSIKEVMRLGDMTDEMFSAMVKVKRAFQESVVL
jgi:hypothetical protein